MLEKRESTNKREEAENKAVREPVKVWSLMSHNACAEPFEERGNWIEKEQLSVLAKETNVIKHGSEEDAIVEKDFYDVFYIAKEKARCCHDHSNSKTE